jgi:hypothetical protein
LHIILEPDDTLTGRALLTPPRGSWATTPLIIQYYSTTVQ